MTAKSSIIHASTRAALLRLSGKHDLVIRVPADGTVEIDYFGGAARGPTLHRLASGEWISAHYDEAEARWVGEDRATAGTLEHLAQHVTTYRSLTTAVRANLPA